VIYLDHHATSPLLPEVLDVMRPWLGAPANPASAHRAGQAAAVAVERARVEVAALIGGHPAGVVFTSGATEANHAWFHAARARGTRRVAVSAVEHPCVRAAAGRCAEVLTVPVDERGIAVLDGLPDDLDGVSLMAANHETGVIQPIDALRARSGWVHVDATAAAGRMPLRLGWVDAVVFSAHKLGGPCGAGALVVRDGGPLPPLLEGGSQERGRRAGTVNTAAVVGFGEACRLARVELDERVRRWTDLRARLASAVTHLGGQVVGGPAVPSVLDAVFSGLPAEMLVMALDLRGVCVSAGAACSSGAALDSPVLRAMRHPEPAGGLRISFGPRTTPVELDALLEALPAVLDAARAAVR
jgi:cysteine desulfurase